jgi:hypothetical protein
MGKRSNKGQKSFKVHDIHYQESVQMVTVEVLTPVLAKDQVSKSSKENL